MVRGGLRTGRGGSVREHTAAVATDHPRDADGGGADSLLGAGSVASLGARRRAEWAPPQPRPAVRRLLLPLAPLAGWAALGLRRPWRVGGHRARRDGHPGVPVYATRRRIGARRSHRMEHL